MQKCGICSAFTEGPGSQEIALCARCQSLVNWFLGRFKTDRQREIVTIDTTFHELSIESLDYIEWISEAKDKFGVAIADVDAEKLRTVGDYLRYIVQHMKT